MVEELSSAVARVCRNQGLVTDEAGLRLFSRFGGPLERVWGDADVERTDGASTVVLASRSANTQIELSPEFLPLVRYLASTVGPIPERELERHAASIERADVVELLRQLVAVGMLARPRTERLS